MPSRDIRGQPACPGVAQRFSEPRVPSNCRATRVITAVNEGYDEARAVHNGMHRLARPTLRARTFDLYSVDISGAS